eukprot:7499566-Alexandrium_andersonii.AAC.1
MAHVAKAFIKALRSHWEQPIVRSLSITQFGIGRWAGTAGPIHLVRAFKERAARARRCWCALFVDLSAAFDRTIRERMMFQGSRAELESR